MEKLEAKLDGIAKNVIECTIKLNSLEAIRSEQEKRVELFWKKDWPELFNRIDSIDKKIDIQEQRVRHLEMEVTKITTKIAIWFSVASSLFAGGGAIYANYLNAMVENRVLQVLRDYRKSHQSIDDYPSNTK